MADARADEVRVSGARCAARVHLAAHDAHLSDVLARLAKVAGFKLSFKSQNDPQVDFDGTDHVARIVARLVRTGNVTIATGPMSGCSGQAHVTKVWVLPDASTRTTRVSSQPRRNAQQARPRWPEAPVDPLYAQSHGAAVQAPADHAAPAQAENAAAKPHANQKP